jgi:uncharacterized protein (TIGR00369 family)
MTGQIADGDLTAARREAMPFTTVLGMRAMAASRQEVRARIEWDRSLCTVGGNLNGGLLMALADTCGGWCIHLNLPADAAGTVTVESKTNFLRGVSAGTSKPSRGRCTSAGRSSSSTPTARQRRPPGDTGDADPGGATQVSDARSTHR